MQQITAHHLLLLRSSQMLFTLFRGGPGMLLWNAGLVSATYDYPVGKITSFLLLREPT